MTRRNTHARVSITNKTNGRPPRLPFSDIKNYVLGQRYELSLVFIGNALSQKLNKQYRGKHKPANVLSFSLDKNTGELFIDTDEALREARKSNRTLKNQVGLLFIHGLFHLNGYRHNSTMESKEERVQKRFNIKV